MTCPTFESSATHRIAILLLAVLCIAVYSNTLDVPYVFDDARNIAQNKHIRVDHLDWSSLFDAAVNSPSSSRPVANVSFALNYYFGEYDVAGYHLTNIIVHLLNGILVYSLAFLTLAKLAKATENDDRKRRRLLAFSALFAAALFITHPIQTQSVTYIVQRMTSLAVTFYLLSLLLYVVGRLSPRDWRRWALWGGSAFAWLLALGSKQIASTLPFIVFLYEWYFFQGLDKAWVRRNLKTLLLLLLVLAGLSWVYLGGEPVSDVLGLYAHRDFTLWQRLLTQFRVVALYISLLVFPHPSRLNLVHDITPSVSLVEPISTLYCLIALLGMMWFAVRIARSHRLISFCLLWFVINLAIESSVVGLEMMFEHRLYLPMVGFAFMMSYLLVYRLAQYRATAVSLVVLIILALGIGAHSRNSVWVDEVTLWSDAVSKSPRSLRAHNNLATALTRRGRVEEAIVHYSRALDLESDYATGHYNLGVALVRRNRCEDATHHFSEALRIDRSYPDAAHNLELCLRRLSQERTVINTEHSP